MTIMAPSTSPILLLLLAIVGSTVAFSTPAFKSRIFRNPSRIIVAHNSPHTKTSTHLYSTLDTRSVNREPIEAEDDNVGAWIPIGSASSLQGLGPQQIRVMGLDLVVWLTNKISDAGQDTPTWSVMVDACPHRLAPLSQGRVDPETGCIECPYHGWQFDSEGNLTQLPQAEPDMDITNIAGSKASYFPTHLAGDLIFAFLPSSVHGEMFLQSVLPEDMFPTVRDDVVNNKTFYVRELPYSADFLAENFMDPSHIPFAHHSLQSTRSDGRPIPMKVLVSNFTHVETTFEDISRGVTRDGIVSFQRPTMYHFRTRDNSTSSYKTNLNIHIIPIEAGKSRVIFGSVIFDWLPDWIKHSLSNRFLNTDSWLHNAEYQARMRSSKYSPYLYATDSDGGVKAFRQWWSRHGFSTAPPNTFGPAAFDSLTLLDRRQQIDPWQHHSRQCASCRGALKVFQRIQLGGLATAITSAVVLKKWPVRAVLVVAASLYARYLAMKVATVIEGNPSPSGYADRSPAHVQDYEKVASSNMFRRKI